MAVLRGRWCRACRRVVAGAQVAESGGGGEACVGGVAGGAGDIEQEVEGEAPALVGEVVVDAINPGGNGGRLGPGDEVGEGDVGLVGEGAKACACAGVEVEEVGVVGGEGGERHGGPL